MLGMTFQRLGALILVLMPHLVCAQVSSSRPRDKMPVNLFPKLPAHGVSPRWVEGTIPADSNSPVCAPSVAPDSTWRTDDLPLPRRSVARLAMRLPAHFSRPDVPSDLPSDVDDRGAMLAVWTDAPSRSVRSSRSVALWTSPRPGYPTILGDVSTEQTAATECHFFGANGRVDVVRFSLRSQSQMQSHLSAVWHVGDGRYVRFNAHALGQDALSDEWTMLTTLTITPRRVR